MLVLKANKASLKILDEKGRALGEFAKNDSMKIESIEELLESLGNDGKEYLGPLESRRYSSGQVIGIEDYKDNNPLLYRTLTGIYNGVHPGNTNGKIFSSFEVETFLNSSSLEGIQIYRNNGGVALVSKKGGIWVGYKTNDKDGNFLPPRLWRRERGFLDTEKWKEFCGENRVMLMESNSIAVEKIIPVGDLFVASVADKIAITSDFKNLKAQDNVPLVGKNICSDPQKDSVIYYMTSEKPKAILQMDTKSNAPPSSAELPRAFENVYSLQLDPSGNFFLFDTDQGAYLFSKSDLKEVGSIPDVFEAQFDNQGHVVAISKEGYVVKYNLEFEKYKKILDEQRVQRALQGISVEDLFQSEGSKTKTAFVSTQDMSHLEPYKQELSQGFLVKIGEASSISGIDTVSNGLGKLEGELKAKRLSEEQIKFLTSDISNAINAKKTEIARPLAQTLMDNLTSQLAKGLSLDSVFDVRQTLSELHSLQGFLDEDTRGKVVKLEGQLDKDIAQMYIVKKEEVGKLVNVLVSGSLDQVGKITNRHEFDDWMLAILPKLNKELLRHTSEIPLEAYEIQEQILQAGRRLREGVREAEKRFDTEYDQIREKATEVTKGKIDIIREDTKSSVERILRERYKSRADAQRRTDSDGNLAVLRSQIEELKKDNPDAAKELERELNVSLANALYSIEQRQGIEIGDTGEQFVRFGNELYPVWEGHVKRKVERRVDVTFIRDKSTVGPGIDAEDVYVDIALKIFNERGGVETVRLFQGEPDEEERTHGLAGKRFGYEPPRSYLKQKDYRKIKHVFGDWLQGDKSTIRQELKKKREKLIAVHKEGNKEEYRRLFDEYARFYSENKITFLRRIDQVRTAANGIEENGKGFVPEWQSHWVKDHQTEIYLSQMAKHLKMQFDLKEGMLMLKGHAGTGKDVLVKMFCSKEGGANRPYFSMDGTKWVTEFELGEDVQLESEDGASQTVKIPSVVLNAITTPGAIMYFNEFNAMSEQAQIFLHSLLDEKRTLTLKTSSGKTVKADTSVLFIASMNPKYPGTFEPQYATRSRMVDLQIDYPPEYREIGKDDPNTNKPYDSSEALRIARGVDSLSDLTIEPNMERNEFVKMWENYVNGINNGAQKPSAVQEFDLKVIMALVQFGARIRKDFILKFGESKDARHALPITQPLTGREFRRAAYVLSKIPDAEKATSDRTDEVARNLLDLFLLSHIDNLEDLEKIRNAMKTWTSSKRPAAI